MKTQLLIILFAASFAFAAPPVVVINSLTSCTVNGSPAGAVVDAIANIPACRAPMLDALLAREVKFAAEKSAAVAVVQGEKAAVESEKAAAEAARLEIIASTKAALADADAVKAKEAAAAVIATAEAPQKEKEIIALEQQKSEIQAKIDALNASAVKKFLPKLKSNTAPKKK